MFSHNLFLNYCVQHSYRLNGTIELSKINGFNKFTLKNQTRNFHIGNGAGSDTKAIYIYIYIYRTIILCVLFTQGKGVHSFLKTNPNGLIVTKEGINRYETLEDLLHGKLDVKYTIDQSYKIKVSVLLASANCVKHDVTLTLTPPIDLVEGTKMIGSMLQI